MKHLHWTRRLTFRPLRDVVTAASPCLSFLLFVLLFLFAVYYCFFLVWLVSIPRVVVARLLQFFIFILNQICIAIVTKELYPNFVTLSKPFYLSNLEWARAYPDIVAPSCMYLIKSWQLWDNFYGAEIRSSSIDCKHAVYTHAINTVVGPRPGHEKMRHVYGLYFTA